MLAENDVMEMTKRGVPGVWTYGFYDGWVPNYMFFIAHSHNSIGRFYEVQSYGPDHYDGHARRDDDEQGVVPAESAAAVHQVGAAQQHQHPGIGAAVLAQPRREEPDLYLENYWLKSKRAVDKGKTGPTYAWVIPGDAAPQGRRRATRSTSCARRASKSRRATTPFKAGNIDVKAGDYIVRGDQPFRTLADMYFSMQNYAPQNPSPYDDTGWTFQYMRDIKIQPVTEKGILDQPMTLLTADAKAPGGIEGTGQRARRRPHRRQQPSSRSGSRTRT